MTDPTQAQENAMLLAKCGHHPDPEIDLDIEADMLAGWAYEIGVGLRSQWPFWSHVSRACRVGREIGTEAALNTVAFIRAIRSEPWPHVMPNRKVIYYDC